MAPRTFAMGLCLTALVLGGCRSSAAGERRTFADRFAARITHVRDLTSDLILEDIEEGFADVSDLVRAAPDEIDHEVAGFTDLSNRGIDIVGDEFARTGRVPAHTIDILAGEAERAGTLANRLRDVESLRLDPETEAARFARAVRALPHVLNIDRVPFADPFDPERVVDVEPQGRPPVLLQRILWRLPP